MATIDEAIKRLRYIFSSEGADKVAADLGKVGDAQAAVTATSDKTSKASLSLDQSFANLERRYISTIRQQQDYAKVQTQVRDAVLQNPALQERGNAVLEAAALKYGQAGIAARAFAAATSGVSGQLIALSAGAGPVGVFLSALGPWGIAAAAGLGIAETAFRALADEANRMGALAQTLRNTAQTIGITTDQVQALNIAAASVGVSTDKNTLSFERFTSQLNQLRNGSGTLYTELLAVDRGLVIDLASTKDVTKAIDLLANAYASATDQVKKNAIARAAFGRGGFDEGRVLTAIDAAGGLDAYKAGLNATDLLTQDQIKHWALLSVEIEHATSMARNNIGSIFTGDVLSAEKGFADIFLDISRVAKDLAGSDAGSKAFMGMAHVLADMVPGLNLMLAVFQYAKGRGTAAPAAPGVPAIPSMVDDPTGSTSVGGAYTVDRDATSAKFQAEQFKAVVAALGSAASAYDRLHERQLTLFADLKAGTIDADTYRKAIAGANVEYATTAINARISALGIMASSSDVALQAQLKINKANLDGAKISKDQAALLVEAAQLQASATKLNIDASFGLASETDILTQKTAEYLNTAKQRQYSDAQIAAGLEVVARNAKAAYEASQVAASATPQLAQLAFDSANVNKQFDTFAVSGLNNLTDSIVAVSMHTKSASEAFHNLGTQVLTSLEQMLVKMLIVQPIAQTLMQTLGGGFGGINLLGLFSGGATSLSAGTAGGTSLFGAGLYEKGGMVGSATEKIWIHPAYYENAPRFDAGGMIPGGGIPIIAHPGERVLNARETAAYNSGAAGARTALSVKVVNEGPPLEEVSRSVDDDGNVEIRMRAVARDEMASPRTNAINKAKYSQSPTLRQRRGV